MRETYEAPELVELGSVVELTRANSAGPVSDNLFVLRGPAEEDIYS